MLRSSVLLLAVAAVIAAATTAAYALWKDQLDVKITVNTGELDMKIGGFSILDQSCGGSQPDYNIQLTDDGEPDLTQYAQLNQPGGNNDVACATGQLVDSDRDGDKDTLVVTVHNAYPRYYNEIGFSIVNDGTVPLKLCCIEIGVGDDCRLASTYYSLDELRSRSGVGIDIDGDGKPDVAISISDGLGELIEPGESINSYTIQLAVLDNAPQGSSLTFCVKPVAVPWNAYSLAVPQHGG